MRMIPGTAEGSTDYKTRRFLKKVPAGLVYTLIILSDQPLL